MWQSIRSTPAAPSPANASTGFSVGVSMRWNPACSAGRPKASEAPGTALSGKTALPEPVVAEQAFVVGHDHRCAGGDQARGEPAEGLAHRVGQRPVRGEGEAELGGAHLPPLER